MFFNVFVFFKYKNSTLKIDVNDVFLISLYLFDNDLINFSCLYVIFEHVVI